MGFARDVSSQVILLHQGKVEEQGPPTQAFPDPGWERFRQFLSGTLK